MAAICGSSLSYSLLQSATGLLLDFSHPQTKENQMRTWIGTCNFNSKVDALRYYRSQECDADEVNRKIRDGDIVIGRPDTQPGDLLYLDSDGRYHLEYDPEVQRREIEVIFKDPRYNYSTEVNGTRKSVCQYFNQPISLAAIEKDGDGEAVLMRPRAIIFFDGESVTTAVNF